jgi:hypothetical protein
MVHRMKRRHSFSVALLLAVGLAGGCASSQMNRIDRNRAIYETWPIETRQAVLDGKVEAGMNPDMVRVAWGEPSEVSVSPAGDEIWVYTKGGDPGSVYYPPGTTNSSAIGMGGPGIGISTGRGGTSIGATGGIGIGGTMGGPMGVGVGGTGIGGGMGGTGGMGGPIVTQPTPPDIREVVFRNGVVVRADKP